MSPTMPAAARGPARLLRSTLPTAALAACLLLSTAANGAAAGRRLSMTELQEFSAASGDTARAEWAIARLRNFLAAEPDSAYAFFARRMLIRAMSTIHAPAKEMVAAADTAETLLPDDPRQTIFFYGEMAQLLLDRGERLDQALDYARSSVGRVPAGQQYAQLRSATLGTLGEAQLRNGYTDSALVSLNTALPDSPDSQAVLFRLGQAYEKSKKPELALDSYVRSLGVYARSDTSALGPLRAVWRKKYGSLKGMDARIEASRAASRRLIALDSRRHERPAPPWTLPDLDGRPVQLSDFTGKVVVIDFWGSWCGPCRQELPIFQSMYERYKDKGVVFIGMNWERPIPGKDLKEIVREFVAQNRYTFPVVLDHQRIATEAYNIEAFPTVFLIDKTGMIRYKNVGVADGIEFILEDQIKSLMD